MATVKGSKQQRMVVVPYRPVRTFLWRAALILLLVGAAAGSGYYGYHRGMLEDGNARTERDLLLAELQGAMDEITKLRQELVNSEQAREVDRQSLDAVQGTILGLREQIVQLEEDVLFYKQIMSPENTETGLVIGQLDLFASAEPARFRYRLELKQMGNNDSFVTGYANVNIQGSQEGEERSIPLRVLSLNEDQLDIKLQFRYFQNIEGELVLPEGFRPEKVQILAVGQGENAKTVQKSFGWLVQDE